ncbi:MAG: redox-regulated ATPase YchF [Oscillospiraceae bacterium]|jgi:GTP-binding protein YchF|nr:redox-regulated ATPase YchF [Oscillospiraceae bacterium]
MKLGIVGLPNVGKSTLFNAITNSSIQSENFPFCTIEPNVGVVAVPDKRLNSLSRIYNPKKITNATVKFFDIAGLVKGASKGEGLGNKFLSNIHECDAILHVVRCFQDDNIIHVNGKVNPESDIETVEMELIFSDIEVLERRISRFKKVGSKNNKVSENNAGLLNELKKFLETGKPARLFDTEKDLNTTNAIEELNLLTNKPVIYAANLSEKDFLNGIKNSELYKKMELIAKNSNSMVLPICAELEMQISDMEDDEKQVFLRDLGLSQSSLDRLVSACYKLLGLISFLTAGKPEVRAWTIKNGTKAPQAAGKIHSDIERGFIRAEIIFWEKLVECGSFANAKEKGLIRSEGKEYVVKDGDVVLFRFNV